MKKFISCLLSMILLLSLLTACGGNGTSDADAPSESEQSVSQTVKLGSTSMYLTVDKKYLNAEASQNGSISLYSTDKTKIEYDIYEWDKDGQTLDEAAKDEIEDLDTTLSEKTINGIPVRYYTLQEEENAERSWCSAFIAEGKDTFVEAVFWSLSEQADAQVNEIISTLSDSTPTQTESTEAK